jgi:flap endonuclease-1
MLKNLSTARAPLVGLYSDPLLSLVSLTRSQFVDFCILLGNDACPRIPKVGPTAAYKHILAHGNIETILEKEVKVRDKVLDPEEYLELVRTARSVFQDLPAISEEVREGLKATFEEKTSGVDLSRVEAWLEERHGIRFVGPDERMEV